MRTNVTNGIPGRRQARYPMYGIQAGEPSWIFKLRVAERHVGVVLALLFVPLNVQLAILLLVSYGVRVWGLEAVFHRLFAHRSYRVGRFGQFVFALIGIQCGQRGPLWWSAKHRDHHSCTDTKDDPHSPAVQSFLRAYMGWFGAPENASTNLDTVADLARYPELRWLNRWYLPVFYGGAAAVFVLGHVGAFGTHITGTSALLWGFYVPSFLQIHSIAMINTLGHMPRWLGGYRRFETADRSVNRPVLALMTFGAGWHNNHHRYPSAARAGFTWYEFDLTYYSLVLLEFLGMVQELRRTIPDEVRREGGLD